MDTHTRSHATWSDVTRTAATAVPLPLPFDDESEAPIPFVLTAAAQRGVLGRALPPLSVVPAAPESVDTRRVQARALLRSGMPVATIAAALDVEVGIVEGWTEDLADLLVRRRRRAMGRGTATPMGSRSPAQTEGSSPATVMERDRILPGLAFALAEIDDHGVTIMHDRVEPVGLLLDALRDQLPDVSDRMRVALRVGPDLPTDRIRVEIAGRLAIDAQRILAGRGGASHRQALDGRLDRRIEIRIDIRDTAAAELVRAWRDGPVAAVSGLRGWDSNPQTFRLTADCSAS